MFSATMMQEVEQLIQSNFKNPEKISVAKSGTPLRNISQLRFELPNFYSKVNFLKKLLQEREEFYKVLVFVGNKRLADRLFKNIEPAFPEEVNIIHSNKTQNYRLRSIRQFGEGFCRILVATDVMARGLDIENISHVINFDTPEYPENYMHRIGRTGRAQKEGTAVLLTTPKERQFLAQMEGLMEFQIPLQSLPPEVELSEELIPEEQPTVKEVDNKLTSEHNPGPAFHEKSDKNKKTNLGGSYRREIKKKYKKPKTRGDKNYNKRNKK